jgi:hypothetical protein
MAKKKVEGQIGSLILDHLKLENRPNFVACKWRATYHGKVVDEGYKSTLDLIVIGGLHTKSQES